MGPGRPEAATAADTLRPMIDIQFTMSLGPRHVASRTLRVPAGSTVLQALASVGLTLPEGATLAVWGRQRPPEWVLRDGDRLACLRPLTVDPMVARRRRQAHQKATLAGRALPKA
jgi:uncharacterized protein